MIAVNARIHKVGGGELPKFLHGIIKIGGNRVLDWNDGSKQSPPLRAGTLLTINKMGDIPRGFWITYQNGEGLYVHKITGKLYGDVFLAILEDVSENEYTRSELLKMIEVLRTL